MNHAIRSFACCALFLLLVSATFAKDQATPKKGKKAKRTPVPAAFKLANKISLTAEQQAKVDELKTQYASKLAEAQKNIDDLYTEEQRAAQKTARQDAVAAGKKGKELKAAVDAAVVPTDEQRQKLAEAERNRKQLTKEVRKQIIAFLTDEQKQQVKAKKKA